VFGIKRDVWQTEGVYFISFNRRPTRDNCHGNLKPVDETRQAATQISGGSDRNNDAPRNLQELSLTATAETTTDQGIQPIIQSGDLAGLDWDGVKMVGEDWRPDVDGTFMRQRFYRGAKWMEQPSTFRLVQTDSNGHPVGVPFTTSAGKDDWKESDDGFVRRFVARQIRRGCSVVGNCASASRFTAQGLVQWRDALHAEHGTQPISPQATRLILELNRGPGYSRSVEIQQRRALGLPLQRRLRAVAPGDQSSRERKLLCAGRISNLAAG
jgi:hypothetical protein